MPLYKVACMVLDVKQTSAACLGVTPGQTGHNWPEVKKTEFACKWAPA
jgi:hypothetical protein